MEVIAKGAEGEIIEIDSNTLKKIRNPKKYRISSRLYRNPFGSAKFFRIFNIDCNKNNNKH